MATLTTELPLSSNQEAPVFSKLQDEVNQGPNTQKIHAIVSLLHKNGINSRQSLVSKLSSIKLVLKKQNVFGNSIFENFQLLTIAIKAYSELLDMPIKFGEKDRLLFQKAGLPNKPIREDLPIPFLTLIKNPSFQRIVNSYDQLEIAKDRFLRRSDMLMNIIQKQEACEVERLIVGCGDTALSLWIEEHPEKHAYPINSQNLPEVLMIGKDLGSWRCDYTLAQRHAMLERRAAPHQPAEFVTQKTYNENRHVNARHLYQANLLSLVDTNAPVLHTNIERIEQHEADKFDVETPWESPNCSYRARIQTPQGTKYIYTKKIDICAGLGPASNPLLMPAKLGSKKLPCPIGSGEFTRLSQFDPKKGCTPLVDGNDYVLANVEHKSRKGRSIIVYGGGGTAAACARQAFHGNDLDGEDKTFERAKAKNSVLWISRNNFDKCGTGTLATAALRNLERLEEIVLLTVKERGDKLGLVFGKENKNQIETYEYECDQLIYSTGQTDDHLQPFLAYIEAQPTPLFVPMKGEAEPVLVGAKAGPDIRLLGAAADAAITHKFDDGTWKFLHSTHVGGDVGPGSMPPTAAQLRMLHSTDEHYRSRVVNLNIDHPAVIEQFLDEMGAPTAIVQPFVDDVLKAREASKPRGFDIRTTEILIGKYRLDTYVTLDGHASLIPVNGDKLMIAQPVMQPVAPPPSPASDEKVFEGDSSNSEITSGSVVSLDASISSSLND